MHHSEFRLLRDRPPSRCLGACALDVGCRRIDNGGWGKKPRKMRRLRMGRLGRKKTTKTPPPTRKKTP